MQTFKSLVEEADFSDVTNAVSEAILSTGPLHVPAAKTPNTGVPASQSGPEVHIDIQIHISPESTSAQIDKIFESMAKHLYGRKGDE